MNYEQKYKEALAWVESIYPELNHEHQMKAETFFPELAESEDERVREDILAFVKREGQHIDKYKWHKWIAWLEKLKVFSEHGDGLYYFGNNGFTYVCNPIWDNSSWLEKQGTSYTKRDVDDAYVEGMTFAKNELEKQKSAEWSEEDEKMYNIVFEEYKNRQYYSHPNLKSRDICGEILGWLKSLKQRCTWKPSKAQMKALDSVIDEYDGYPEFDSLVSLKNDLKKLREK